MKNPDRQSQCELSSSEGRRERENRVQSFDDVFVLEASNKVAHEQVTIFSTPMRIQIMQSSKTLKGAEPPIERINTRELKQM